MEPFTRLPALLHGDGGAPISRRDCSASQRPLLFNYPDHSKDPVEIPSPHSRSPRGYRRGSRVRHPALSGVCSAVARPSAEPRLESSLCFRVRGSARPDTRWRASPAIADRRPLICPRAHSSEPIAAARISHFWIFSISPECSRF